ncbi:MAG: type IX secretion system outer membrane channel protein PorV [Flavobacteriales bacterium]
MTRSFLSCTSLLTVLSLQAQVSTDCANQIAGQNCGDRLNTITTAVPFLMISPDSRAGGMGDAGVAVSPDANAIHWNPSKLAFAEDEMELSISYSPWLRNLVPDMNLAYLSFYKKLANKRSAIGASLRYFSLGSITFTDQYGGIIRDFTPKEFAVDIAFAQQFSDVFSGGIALRYVNSNLTGGISVQGADSKAGQTVAADVSFFYTKRDLQLGEKDGEFNFGLNVSNIGGKMRYTETSETDFIPINLRLGPCLKVDLDEYNSVAFNLDINKLLVPTPPIYLQEPDSEGVLRPARDDDNNLIVASGQDPDVGVATGIFGSFSDAPGVVTYDDNGNPVVESGSVTREEFREVNLAGGLEYWYAKQFAFRAGYFWEHATKGNRKYFTLGAGLRYNVFAIDLSYLIANSQQSPLANTLRFTLGFNFNSLKAKKKDSDEG